MKHKVQKHFFSTKIITLILVIVAFSLLLKPYIFTDAQNSKEAHESFWEVTSIDTMKFSRDVSREKLNDPSFDLVIHEQINDIAKTGATHVAIATPYDEEFNPILKRWVSAARKNGLKIWFRGNWSGWEQWFEYPKITREEHIVKTQQFIEQNPELFEDGDIFTACPECENGGPGDPRHNNDATGHRKFLIDEYKVTKEAFKKIGKDVKSNYNSMNGDVARLIMDKETTQALDGIIVVDHYVPSYEQLNKDVSEYAKLSGGKVILGEFGAPIPDLHGDLTEEEQAEWILNLFKLLAKNDDIIGLNYWTNIGGSAAIWNSDGTPRAAVDSVTKAFKPYVFKGTIKNDLKQGIENATIVGEYDTATTDKSGNFTLISLQETETVSVSANGYKNALLAVEATQNGGQFTLENQQETVWHSILKFFRIFLP